MKFNFKKVASVIASAVMITSTVGFAAASTYPAPFSSGATIVYGSAAASSDIAAAISIQQNLNAATTAVTSGTSSATVTGGDSVAIKAPSSYLTVGQNLTQVKSTQITSSDMPNLLADGSFRATGNQYAYTQKLVLSPTLQFNQFSSSSYNNGVPTLGVKIASSAPIMNYTLSFSSSAQSAVDSSGYLTGFTNKKITILGKDYTILHALNGTHVELDLMGGSVTDTVNYNEDKTYTVGNSSYDVKLVQVDSDKVKFNVNGETTDSLADGDTYTLADGTVLGVTSHFYQAFAGGAMSADITLGQGKLTLKDGQTVQLNNNNVNGLTTYISASPSGSNTNVNSITMVWSANNDEFLASGTDVVIPGFNSVKLAMTNLTETTQETTKIMNDGNYNVQVQTTLLNGPVNFDLLSGNGTIINKIGQYGSSGANTLRTSNAGSANARTLSFNSQTDSEFIATFVSGSTAESHLLKASTTTNNNANATYLQEYMGSSGWQDVQSCKAVTVGNSCTIGNVQLTVTSANNPGYITNFTGGSNVVFNELATKAGLLMYLPQSDTAGIGYINLTANPPANYNLSLYEQDKNSNVGSGNSLNVSIQSLPSSSTSRLQAYEVYGSFPTDSGVQTLASLLPSTTSSSSVRTGYEAGDSATMVQLDQTNTPNSVALEYHGIETYANVFVASSGAIVTPGSSGGTTAVANVVTDKDVGDGTAYASKNLIVVGGSCINTVALKIISPTATAPVCGDDFKLASKVSPDQYLIETVANPYAATGSSNVAMLVAGYEAADTTNAAAKVLTGVDTTVGTSQVYPIVAATP